MPIFHGRTGAGWGYSRGSAPNEPNEPKPKTTVEKSRVVAPVAQAGPLLNIVQSTSEPLKAKSRVQPVAPFMLTDKAALPVYQAVFGVSKGQISLNDNLRTSVCGLVSNDGNATVLYSTDGHSVLDAFERMLRDGGIKPHARILASADLILTVYNEALGSSTRRREYDESANPDASNKLFANLIAKALNMGASDVHVHVLDEAKPPVSRVYFRVEGSMLLQESELINPSIAHNVMRAAYTGISADAKSRSDTSFKTGKGIYSTIQLPAVQNVRLRMQTRPHVNGYGANFRVLSHDGLKSKFRTLKTMGFSDEQTLEIVDAFSSHKGGLILFIAGTGEGKTTTLMTAIPLDRNFDTRFWVSIEDPVEIIDNRLFQSPVRRDTSNSEDTAEHEAAMADTLRFDPDGINAGEIRDQITARLAERAAMTGHITAATLHGTEPFSAFNRLMDLGMRKENLLDGVARLFCHQRLIQTICGACSTPANKSDVEFHQTFLSELARTYSLQPEVMGHIRVKGSGCDKCRPTGPLAGISGRTVIAEVVTFTPPIIDALREDDGTRKARDLWRNQRVAEYHEEGTLGKPLAEHALYKLLRGKISPETFEAVTDKLSYHRPMPIKGRTPRVLKGVN